MNLFRRSNLHFGPFRFDSARLALFHGRERIALRPKPAALLGLLLASPNTVLSKREILANVWGRDCVSDQSLFQTVSELRRALQPLDPIVTHPNIGYCFSLSVRRASTASLAAAAMFVLAIGFSAWQIAPVKLNDAKSDTSLSPAFVAFATGVDYLRRDQPQLAERYFRLATQENPGFAEARLMIGEALLAQGRIDDARVHTDQLLASRSNTYDYTGVGAMSLISRTEDAAGQSTTALHWALAAARQAYDQGFVCAAVGIEDQIARLLAQQDAAHDASGAEPLSDAPLPTFVARDAAVADMCLDMGAGPDAQLLPSTCEPGRVALRRRPAQMPLHSNA